MNTYTITPEQIEYIISKTAARVLQDVSDEIRLVLDGNSSTDARELLQSIENYLQIEAVSINTEASASVTQERF